ncbi:MAG: Uncharacterized protein FD150_1263 [Rhodobacteraceae bacterium]|nr:MAG: Uncharacterized protein FD150_1263 [Paracoccaceae bacterium]
MKRRELLCGLVAGLVFASPAMAESVADSIVRQLERLGFRKVSQERTLLGRVRIVGDRKDRQREIIVNPNTGEILRDLWMPVADDGSGGVTIIDDHPGKSDDDEGEDKNKDHRGREGGKSGSGGGDDGDD